MSTDLKIMWGIIICMIIAPLWLYPDNPENWYLFSFTGGNTISTLIAMGSLYLKVEKKTTLSSIILIYIGINIAVLINGATNALWNDSKGQLYFTTAIIIIGCICTIYQLWKVPLKSDTMSDI